MPLGISNEHRGPGDSHLFVEEVGARQGHKGDSSRALGASLASQAGQTDTARVGLVEVRRWATRQQLQLLRRQAGIWGGGVKEGSNARRSWPSTHAVRVDVSDASTARRTARTAGHESCVCTYGSTRHNTRTCSQAWLRRAAWLRRVSAIARLCPAIGVSCVGARGGRRADGRGRRARFSGSGVPSKDASVEAAASGPEARIGRPTDNGRPARRSRVATLRVPIRSRRDRGPPRSAAREAAQRLGVGWRRRPLRRLSRVGTPRGRLGRAPQQVKCVPVLLRLRKLLLRGPLRALGERPGNGKSLVPVRWPKRGSAADCRDKLVGLVIAACRAVQFAERGSLHDVSVPVGAHPARRD